MEGRERFFKLTDLGLTLQAQLDSLIMQLMEDNHRAKEEQGREDGLRSPGFTFVYNYIQSLLHQHEIMWLSDYNQVDAMRADGLIIQGPNLMSLFDFPQYLVDTVAQIAEILKTHTAPYYKEGLPNPVVSWDCDNNNKRQLIEAETSIYSKIEMANLICNWKSLFIMPFCPNGNIVITRRSPSNQVINTFVGKCFKIREAYTAGVSTKQFSVNPGLARNMAAEAYNLLTQFCCATDGYTMGFADLLSTPMPQEWPQSYIDLIKDLRQYTLDRATDYQPTKTLEYTSFLKSNLPPPIQKELIPIKPIQSNFAWFFNSLIEKIAFWR